MAFYIIAAIAALLLLLVALVFLLNIRIAIQYSTITGELCVVAHALFIRIPLYPRPKSTKIKKKSKKSKRTSAHKAKSRSEKNLDSAAQKGKNASEGSEKSFGQKVSELCGMIKHLCISLKALAPSLIDAITLEIKELNICVGGEDAAKTALCYGALCSAVETLFALENSCKGLKLSTQPHVGVDFTSQRLCAELQIVLIIRAYKVLYAIYRAEDAYYTYKAEI